MAETLRPEELIRIGVTPDLAPDVLSPSVDVGSVRVVDDVDTATSAKWAPTNRPVLPSAGVYTGMDVSVICGRVAACRRFE
jgi:hypothetical protein